MSIKTNALPEQIADVLRTRDNFLILSHMRPDGDAIGCQIAMALCLKQMGKRVTVWNEDGMPEKFTFLPGSELVSRPPAVPESFEVVIALDNAVLERIGTPLQSIANSPLWINIDHHVTNQHYGDLAFVNPKAPAAGEILYELLRATDLPITYAMADSLFVAISTDTGSFQYPNTTARTFEIAAELVKAGANVGSISQAVYESYPLRRLALLRETLNTLQLDCDGRLASIALTAETVAQTEALPEDTEGLIDPIRAIQGVIAALFLEELPEGKIRISMRSKDPRLDVSKLCQQFGGGGHTLAAGARIKGSLADVRRRVIEATSHEILAGIV